MTPELIDRIAVAMSKYTVRLKPPKKHKIPPALERFGKWLAKQPYGAVGWFEMIADRVPREWNPEVAKRLARDGFSFVSLPDGSLLVALKPKGRRQPAVVLLGSEGETDTVATSIEEFLHLLAAGETGIDELDDEEADRRGKLRAWLEKAKIEAPPAEAFDFDAYLDDELPRPSPARPSSEKGILEKGASKPKASKKKLEPAVELDPFLTKLVEMVGRRADDAELIDFVTKDLGQKKVPSSIGEVGDMKYVVAPKLGVELGFDKEVLHVDYPPIQKTKRSWVPYLCIVWLRKKLPAPLPFGLAFDMSTAELEAALGPPDDEWRTNKRDVEYTWIRPLDAERGIVLRVDGRRIVIKVDYARDLRTHRPPDDPTTGLFVAWAIRRKLLDSSLFPAHDDLIQSVRAGKEKGSAFVQAAMPRGLWDHHLVNKPGLWNAAFQYFHDVGKRGWIKKDLIKAFGKRKGEYGHDEPRLDVDDAGALAKAMKIFDQRFAEWL